MKSFWLAWQFLTRFPAPHYEKVSDREAGHIQVYFPWVGLVLGALLYGAFDLLGNFSVPQAVVAALALTLWVASTGALHLDGLADTADAWVGGHGDRERSLRIMKDPVSGPSGVTALVLILLMKISMLHGIGPAELPALIFVPALARGVVPLLFLSLPYLRESGLGKAMSEHRPIFGIALAWVPVLALGYWLLEMQFLWLLLAMALAYLLLFTLYKRQFGGITGDMAGAAVEVTETLILLAVLLS